MEDQLMQSGGDHRSPYGLLLHDLKAIIKMKDSTYTQFYSYFSFLNSLASITNKRI
ncbi:hypothetical protein KMU_35590 [Proteus vulgaris]|nr:hypothetical protein KMU_35590 [Proteus vulgaris]